MQFAYLDQRAFLGLAAAVAVLALVALVRKRRALRRLAAAGADPPLVLARRGRQALKCLLLTAAALLLGVAVLGPQWGWTEVEAPPHRGRDVLVLLDVSRSMLAEDVAPNRLARARADLRDLSASLERAGGYRIGLIAFAERAAVLCPLTSDYRSFEEELAAASLDTLRLRGFGEREDGTEIGLALERASQVIDDASAPYTDVLLVSDGGDMDQGTLEAADTLARRGIPVHALGLGDPVTGALIPVRGANGRMTHLRYQGEVVRTRLEESVLRAVAGRTHGEYFAAGTGFLELDKAFGEVIAAKEGVERSEGRRRLGIHRFQWFVAPALVLLLLDWLLTDSRRRPAGESVQSAYFRWARRAPAGQG
jgi:Ca-activated chloride channel family protein